MHWSVFSMCSLYSIGNLLLACWTGCIEGSMHMYRYLTCFLLNQRTLEMLPWLLLWTLAVVKWFCEIGTICGEWSWNDCFGEEWSYERGTICGEWSCNDYFGEEWSWNACILMADFSGCCPLFLGLISLYVWCPECNMSSWADGI